MNHLNLVLTLRDSYRVPLQRPFIYYDRSEFLIDGDGKKSAQKKVLKKSKQKSFVAVA